ncbi:MAG: serine/threonine-protein phosphatase, partial [Nocardiopsaceae bacterium]|nr:serine/threonine-protein phosphatase [Nocardiopsaceae bacterium]
TEDDSWAGRMVAWGVMSEREAQADAKAHVLTGWLGADATESEPRVRTFTPPGPGAVVVCSDGLWNYLPEADTLRAAAPFARTDPRRTAAALVRTALDAGGHDNVTVVVVPFPLAEHSGAGIGRQLNRERSDE